MRVMRFSGGLGNTMFEYATYLQLKKIYMYEDIMIDTTRYKIKMSEYPFVLTKIFDMPFVELTSLLNDSQHGMLEKELDKINILKEYGYNNLNEAFKQDEDFLRGFVQLSLVEVPQCLIKVGMEFNIVSDPKLNLSIEGFRNVYEKRDWDSQELKQSIFKCFPLYLTLKVLINKNVRKKFIKDIFALKKPDFNGYAPVSRLISEGDTYYNIYGNPNDCEGIREELLEAFTFKPITDKENLDTLTLIQSTNSVSIHARAARVADYEYGMKAAVKRRYFIKAVKYIKRKVVNPVFFIFSDNINWCRENLNTLGLTDTDQIIFIDHNRGENSYRDMQLMSLCKHNIVPNSTFSWWGAYLNQNPDKIVCTPYATLPGTISF